MKRYISLDDAIKLLRKAETGYRKTMVSQVRADMIAHCIKLICELPAADVVSAEDYNHLLKIANKMHLWIFMNTGDEQAAYDECGLTDEDNAMLGYGGSWELRVDNTDSAE